MVNPLLQQGLSDTEEIITYKTLMSLSSLIEQGIDSKLVYENLFDLIFRPIRQKQDIRVGSGGFAIVSTPEPLDI